MTPLQLALIVFTVFALSLGQIFFKLAAEELNADLSHMPAALLNFKVFLALAVYFIATILWLLLLKQVPLRTAYPFAALAFVFVPLLAHWTLGEALTWESIVGAAFIVLGVLVSSLGITKNG
jgi:drug/metabolite transporter (DMT)-like permease